MPPHGEAGAAEPTVCQARSTLDIGGAILAMGGRSLTGASPAMGGRSLTGARPAKVAGLPRAAPQHCPQGGPLPQLEVGQTPQERTRLQMTPQWPRFQPAPTLRRSSLRWAHRSGPRRQHQRLRECAARQRQRRGDTGLHGITHKRAIAARTWSISRPRSVDASAPNTNMNSRAAVV